MTNPPHTSVSNPGNERVTIIRPSTGWVAVNSRELWEHRELLYFLVWRDIKIRYKQTLLGAAWAIIQPLFTMVVFSLFFGRLAQMPSDGLPYPLFCLAGLVPWQFFAFGLNESSNSLVGNRTLITKVYFPRLTIPVAPVLAGLVDFFAALVLLFIFMAWYGIVPGFRTVMLLPLLALAAVASLGAGLWLAALNVQYRDVRYVVPFLIQLWLFATPIAYPSSLLPPAWRPLYGMNPMVGVVDGFRWALLGASPPGLSLVVSAASAFTLAIGGALYFRRTERIFADVV